MHRRTNLVIVRAFLGACLGATLVGLAGCASPTSHFYTLSAASTPGAPSSSLSVVVGPISVPATVDRPEIVVSTGPNQVRLAEYDLWASPLQDEISRVVVENLVTMLGTAHVSQSSQTVGDSADYRVLIEVQKFDSMLGGAATLDAVWTVRRPKDDQSVTRRTTVTESVSGESYSVLAAAHSRAIARLSRDIADAVWELERAAR